MTATVVAKQLRAALKSCPVESNLYSSLAALVNPLSYAHIYSKLEQHHWEEQLLPLVGFAAEVKQFFSEQPSPSKFKQKASELHDRAIQHYTHLDRIGLFDAYQPSLPTAVVMSKLTKCIGIKYKNGNFLFTSPTSASDMDANRCVLHLHTILRSTASLYSCLEHLLSSPPQSAYPKTAIYKAAALSDLFRTIPPKSSAVTASRETSRFVTIINARVAFNKKLEESALPQPYVANLKEFISILLDGPFIPVEHLSKVFSGDVLSSDLEDTHRQPNKYNRVFFITEGNCRRVWSTHVTVKAYDLDVTDRASYAQFYDAVLRLRALQHRGIITFYGAHWPFPLANSRASTSEKPRALIILERMTTCLSKANGSKALASFDSRKQILSDILSAIVSLHCEGIRHGSINTHTVLLRIQNGVLCGCAKLDHPPLAEAIFVPASLSTMTVEELMFQPPDKLRRENMDYLTDDVWSFGVLACLLLLNSNSSLKVKEECASIFWRKGPVFMAERCLKEIKNPKLNAVLSCCFRDDPTARITSSELAMALEPFLKTENKSSNFVKDEAGLATVESGDSVGFDYPAEQREANNRRLVGNEPTRVPGQHLDKTMSSIQSPVLDKGGGIPSSQAMTSMAASTSQQLGYEVGLLKLTDDALLSSEAGAVSRDYAPGPFVSTTGSCAVNALRRSDGENSFEKVLMDVATQGAKRAANEVEIARRRKRGKHDQNSSNFTLTHGTDSSSTPVSYGEAQGGHHGTNIKGHVFKGLELVESGRVKCEPTFGPDVEKNDSNKSKNVRSNQPRADSEALSNSSFSDVLNIAKTYSNRKPDDSDVKEEDLSNQNQNETWKSRVRQRPHAKRHMYVEASSDDDDIYDDEGDEHELENSNTATRNKASDDSDSLQIPTKSQSNSGAFKQFSVANEMQLKAGMCNGTTSSQTPSVNGSISQKKTKKRRRYGSQGLAITDDAPKGKAHLKTGLISNVTPGMSNISTNDPLLPVACTGPGHESFVLGAMFEEGTPSAHNMTSAVNHYKVAVAEGNVKARTRLARCYESGLGVEKDLVQASILFCSAADAGDCDAFYEAGRCCELGIGMEVNFPKAFHYYNCAANNGNTDALVCVGKLTENGKGTATNLSAAFSNYEAAAKQKNVKGKVELASCYAKGKGVKRCVQKAVELYRDAANCGDPGAMLALGLLYEDGNGVRKNCEQALKLYRQSAALNHAPGETALGQCYLWGYGVPLDYKQARNLFLKATSQGYALAFHELGVLYKEGNGVEKNLETAVSYFLKASEQGCEVAMVQLGECLYHGRGTMPNLEAAFKWFRKAAELGAADGCRWLGDCYADGIGVEKNLKKAVENYKKGSELGNAAALTSLGSCYENGHGVPANMTKAVSMYRRAGESGDHTAENNLGILYESGKHVKLDYAKAVTHYRRAIQLGSTEAMCNLADCYASGNGVTKCMKTAIKWYEESAKHGLAGAQCELGICYYEGKGMPINAKRAVELFYQASEHEAEGLRQLGRAYSEGKGVQQNAPHAFTLLYRAATEGEGNMEACFDVGKCFEFGFGVPRNIDKAIQFYENAARSGHHTAACAAGNLHFRAGRYAKACSLYRDSHGDPSRDETIGTPKNSKERSS